MVESPTLPSLPRVVKATIVKENKKTKTGIGFKKRDQAIVINKISEGSLFSGTDLHVGYECLSVNGQTIRDPKHALKIVMDSIGEVTLIACSGGPRPQGTAVTIVKKKSGDYKPGLWFRPLNKVLVRISDIDESGPFANTSLRPGDVCLSINNALITDPGTASQAMKRAEGLVAMLYFSLTALRENAVEKIFLDENRKPCVVTWLNEDLCSVKSASGGLINITLRFHEDGTCEDVAPWKNMFSRDEDAAEGEDTIIHLHWYNKHIDHRIQQLNKILMNNMSFLERSMKTTDSGSPDEADKLMQNLTRLADMHRKKLLTIEEFAAAKAKLFAL